MEGAMQTALEQEEVKRTEAMDRLLEKFRHVIIQVTQWETLNPKGALTRVFNEGFGDPAAVEAAYDEIYRIYDEVGTSKGKLLRDWLFDGCAIMFTVRKMVVK